MLGEWQIRRAIFEDWEQLFPLLRGMGGLDGEQQTRKRFEALIAHSDHYLPVAVAAEQLVGYGWAQDYGPHLRTGDKRARLHDLFVQPEHRQRGIGQALFHAVTTWARQADIHYLEWQANLSASGFYQRLGHVGDPCPQPDFPFFEIEFAH